MKRCDYACGSEEHLIARRQLLGGVAVGTGAVLGGVGTFASPDAVAKMAKDQKRMIVVRMAGGLSQLESWDPKPGTDTGGPFRSIPPDGFEHHPSESRGTLPLRRRDTSIRSNESRSSCPAGRLARFCQSPVCNPISGGSRGLEVTRSIAGSNFRASPVSGG